MTSDEDRYHRPQSTSKKKRGSGKGSDTRSRTNSVDSDLFMKIKTLTIQTFTTLLKVANK